MFVILGYQGAAGAAAVNFDLSALLDPDFSQRNGHYVFTEPYKLLASANVGASDTEMNLLCPTWNAIGKFNIYPPVRAAQPVMSTYVDLRTDIPTNLPLNEEFQVQTSNNAGAGVQTNGLLWLGTPDWNKNLPQGIMPISVRCSVAFTGVAHAWSGPSALTFEQSLRGGVYSVVGARFQSAGCIAHRAIFPRQKLYQGRKLRPGDVALNAIGDFPPLYGYNQSRLFGEWGRFHTFEPPQWDVFANAAGAATGVLILDMIYLGTDVSLLDSGSVTI
jgi:hypothetical protein